jgi:hypothetical protein
MRQSQLNFFLLFSEFGILYDTFRPTRPSSGNTPHVHGTWEEIRNSHACVCCCLLCKHDMAVIFVKLYAARLLPGIV